MSTSHFVARAATLVLMLASTAVFSQAQKASDPAAVSPPAPNGPIVKVSQGEAQGSLADGVAIFKGLPFAAPPVILSMADGGRFAAIQERRDAFLAAYDPDGTGDADRIIARYVTDASISEPDRDLARLHAKHGNATYVYHHFSYTPAAQRATLFGLAHGGELAYVFNVPRAAAFDDEGKAIAAAANKYWAQFAKTGDPDSAGGPTWPKFDAADEYVMEFPASGTPVTAKHFHKDRLDWVETGLGK